MRVAVKSGAGSVELTMEHLRVLCDLLRAYDSEQYRATRGERIHVDVGARTIKITKGAGLRHALEAVRKR